MKTIITFWCCRVFIGYTWAHGQRSICHSLGYLHIFKSSILRASCWWNNFGSSSFQTRVIPGLVSLFTLSNHFLAFDSFLSIIPKGWNKNQFDFQMQTFVLNLEKEFIKKLSILEACQTLKILGSHQQPCSFFFFLVFADFRTLRDNLGKLQLVVLKEKKVVGTG